MAVLFLVVAFLLVPVFAHGCHGDDVDHEPGFAPTVQSDPTPAARRNSLR